MARISFSHFISCFCELSLSVTFYRHDFLCFVFFFCVYAVKPYTKSYLPAYSLSPVTFTFYHPTYLVLYQVSVDYKSILFYLTNQAHLSVIQICLLPSYLTFHQKSLRRRPHQMRHCILCQVLPYSKTSQQFFSVFNIKTSLSMTIGLYPDLASS